MKNLVYENCQLELDMDRGVLYVHDKDTGITVLRICQMKQPVVFNDGVLQIDITKPERISYSLVETNF